jgi:hypothetical protein
MPIVSADIEFRLSGGAANADPDASLGGAKSSVEIVDATVENLFDNVSSAETAAGDTEYRCLYVHNAHATLTLQDAVAWIQSNTPSTDTTAEIGPGSAAVNAEEQSVANESTAPTAVTFSAAANEGAAITLGDIPAGQHKAIWVKRIVSAAAGAYNDDGLTIRVKGDTGA